MVNVSSGFFVVQKSKAQSPPAPETQGWQFTFTDDSKNSIQALIMLQNQPQKLIFSGKTAIDKSQFTYSGENPFLANFNLFYVFPFVPDATFNNGVCTVRNQTTGDLSDEKFYLIVAQESEGQPYWQYGMATYLTTSKFYLRFRNAGDITQYCINAGRVNEVIKNFTTVVNSAGATLVKSATSITDVAGYCTQLTSNWENLKTAMRNFLIPPPGDPKQTNWGYTGSTPEQIALGGTFSTIAQLVTSVFHLAIGDINGAGLKNDYLFNITIDYGPTESGLNAWKTIADLAQQVQEQSSTLVSQYGDTLPPGCDKLKKFKWNQALEGQSFYTSLNEFNSDAAKIYETFKKFAAILDQPSSSGGDTCGPMTASLGNPFPWLFCKAGEITHAWASAIMTKAIEWLTASIGLKNVGFQSPEKDENAGKISGGAPGTSSSSSGTPTTPTTGTPGGTTTESKPMNVTVTIAFTSQSAYDLALNAFNGGHSAYVKNSTGGDPIVIDKVSVKGKDAGKRQITVNFTTSAKIPSSWKSVVIYGRTAVSSTTNVYRFEIMGYPPSGPISETSST